VDRMFESVCLFVCPEHNLKTNDLKVFKFGIWNDLGDILEIVWFGNERSKVKVTESISAFFTLMTVTPMLTECLIAACCVV